MLRSSLAVLALTALVISSTGCDTSEPTLNEIRRVFITEVRIASVDFVNPESSDGDWDSDFGGGPDVYFDLVDDDTGAIYESTLGDEFPNVDSRDLPLVWSASPGSNERSIPEIDVNQFNRLFAFDIWDEDPQLTKGDDDFMGFTESFTFGEIIDRGAPASFRVQSADGRTVVDMQLRYTR